jgi:hypothetical protein
MKARPDAALSPSSSACLCVLKNPSVVPVNIRRLLRRPESSIVHSSHGMRGWRCGKGAQIMSASGSGAVSSPGATFRPPLHCLRYHRIAALNVRSDAQFPA